MTWIVIQLLVGCPIIYAESVKYCAELAEFTDIVKWGKICNLICRNGGN